MDEKRWRVTYHLTGGATEARHKAEDICIEQTVEFPADLIPRDSYIRREIFGRVERFVPAPAGDGYLATISFSSLVAGSELTQFINVIFGNISLKPGIRLVDLALPETMLARFAGPRLGRDGLRDLLNAHGRPILCTALKPMGLSAGELADLAYHFARGGVDIIKDDHGLADQPFAPFEARVAKCAAAVAKANRETGHHAIYMPNVTAPADQLLSRARFAREAGAGGLLIAPGLTGFDAMRRLAEDDAVALPIMAHPAFLGSFVTSRENGIAHGLLFGTLMRLAGADSSVFPNYGGRFSFSREECAEIAAATATPLAGIKPIFPAPGGGMTLERLPDLRALYGSEVILLIGGALHRPGPDLEANARLFCAEARGKQGLGIRN